ncbi:MAG: hypothetical protein ACK56I_08970, partial [bacterium]
MRHDDADEANQSTHRHHGSGAERGCASEFFQEVHRRCRHSFCRVRWSVLRRAAQAAATLATALRGKR